MPRVKKFTSKSSGLVMPMCHFTGQNVWILKPTGFNRGKGIHVVNSIAKLKKLIKEYSRGRESQPNNSLLMGNGGVVDKTVGQIFNPNSTIYPVSKFMEPQALNTKQMMLATMQASAKTQNGQGGFNRPSLVNQGQQSRQVLRNLTSGPEKQPPQFITDVKTTPL